MIGLFCGSAYFLVLEQQHYHCRFLTTLLCVIVGLLSLLHLGLSSPLVYYVEFFLGFHLCHYNLHYNHANRSGNPKDMEKENATQHPHYVS